LLHIIPVCLAIMMKSGISDNPVILDDDEEVKSSRK
jgi:hypothetical protein